jgi:HPt (histidine-containing phosphotransfer) domain-containing protein
MSERSLLQLILLRSIPRAAARVKSHLSHALTRVARKGQDVGPQDTSEPAAPVLDLDVFNELHVTLGGSTERVRSVYSKFVDTSAQRIGELRTQPPAVGARTLHALKGSAGMVGAASLAALAARTHDGTVADASLTVAAIDRIELELGRFRAALTAQLERVDREERPRH